MKSVSRYLVLASVLGLFSLAQLSWAGECCDKAVADAKAGKACEKCLKKECCKHAVGALSKDEKKPCEHCAGKKAVKNKKG